MGLRFSQIYIFSIHLPSQMITKIEESDLQNLTPIKKFFTCQLEDNCLNVITECCPSSQICVIIAPSLKLIITKNKQSLTKYYNSSIDIEKVVKIQLLPEQKKLVILYNLDNQTLSVDLMIFRFDSKIKKDLILKNTIVLSKQREFKSVYKVLFNDQTCLNIYFTVYDALIFWRRNSINVCIVYLDMKISCFMAIEGEAVGDKLIYLQEDHKVNKNKKYFEIAKKVGKYILVLNLIIFCGIWLKMRKEDYQGYLPTLTERIF